jgi:hypothetical protein
MSYDQLSRDYEPRDPYSSAEQRQKGIGLGQYAHNMAQQQERFHPGAALGASIEKVRPQGNVTRELQQYEKHLNALICVIDELDRRLATATIPQPETSNTLRGSDQSGSALASQLSSFNNMLAHQINRLESIYQGVDL